MTGEIDESDIDLDPDFYMILNFEVNIAANKFVGTVLPYYLILKDIHGIDFDEDRISALCRIHDTETGYVKNIKVELDNEEFIEFFKAQTHRIDLGRIKSVGDILKFRKINELAAIILTGDDGDYGERVGWTIENGVVIVKSRYHGPIENTISLPIDEFRSSIVDAYRLHIIESEISS
jgi:sporulation protein YlmC with PRC-barrel domain